MYCHQPAAAFQNVSLYKSELAKIGVGVEGGGGFDERTADVPALSNTALVPCPVSHSDIFGFHAQLLLPLSRKSTYAPRIVFVRVSYGLLRGVLQGYLVADNVVHGLFGVHFDRSRRGPT